MSLSTAALLSRQLSRQIARLGARPKILSSSINSSSINNTQENVNNKRLMATVSAGVALQNLAANNPHVDVIRYHHKNEKWTLKHVNHFADALAIGFLDNGLIPGDVVLSWLPLHFSEQHILQFACSKAGLVLYNLDPTVACTDKESAKKSLAKALELTEANVLITQEAGNDVNYVYLVESVIPETRIFDFGEGMPFFTPRFPHLRFPIHTGFDYEDKGGMVPLKDMLCPSGQLSSYLGGFKIDGSTPLMGSLQVGSDGVPTGKGKVLTNEEVVKGKIWPEFNSILEKKYIEVEGVGVVF